MEEEVVENKEGMSMAEKSTTELLQQGLSPPGYN